VIPLPDLNRTAVIALAVLLALVAGGIIGWHYGADRATAKGEAKYAALEASHALASANATEEARQKTEAMAKRGESLSAELLTTRRALATARADITRRIPDATAGIAADCLFGPDFVRLWNEAYGFRPGPLPQADSPRGAAGQPAPAGAAGPGLQPGAPVAATPPVTPTDALAHVRDMGAYLQEVEAQRDKLAQLLREWAQ
jgi:hypothetical protein